MADRLNYVINRIDESLRGFAFKDIRFFGQARQETKKNQRQPVVYRGNGEHEPAMFSDKHGLNVYHRVLAMSENEDMASGFGTNILKEETFNMVMVVYGSQKKVNNAAIDINYRVADDMKGYIPTTLIPARLTTINAQSLRITVTGVEYDKSKVFAAELPDHDYKIKPESVLFSINYSIVMKFLQDCKAMACGSGPVAESPTCEVVTIYDRTGAVITTIAAGGSYTERCGLQSEDLNQLYAE